jgi:hypothetical protein
MEFLQASAADMFVTKTGEVLEYEEYQEDTERTVGNGGTTGAGGGSSAANWDVEVAETLRETNRSMAEGRARMRADMTEISSWMDSVNAVLTRTPEERSARLEERRRRKEELRRKRALARADAEMARAQRKTGRAAP